MSKNPRFTHSPMQHQKRSAKHYAKNTAVFDMSDCGTGKTFVNVIDIASRGGKTLVMAPKTLLETAWGADIRKFAPWLTYSCAYASNREKAFEVDVDVYITNTDAAVWLAGRPAKFWKKFEGGTLIIDESSSFKHHTSQRSKAMGKVKKRFKYRRCLSATPFNKSITEIWHQAAILDDGHRLGTSFYEFRSQVCTPIQVGPNINALEWTDKPGADLAVMHMLRDIVIRHSLEECVDIPPNHTYPVYYELPAKHAKLYKTMEALSLAPFDDGKIITAVNAAILANKLLQIASGAVYDEAGGYKLVDTGRYELVLDLVEARQHSLCAFLWKHQRDYLIEQAKRRKIEFAVIDGETNDRDRIKIIADFQAGHYQTIFCHPQSTGHGITATRGTATIWSSPTFNAELAKQFMHRVYRKTQTEKTENIIVCASGTRDEGAYEMCTGRLKTMTDMLAYARTTQE